MVFLKKLALFSACMGLVAFSGCNKNATSPEDNSIALDGDAGLVASEVSAMDAATFDFTNMGAGAPKLFVGGPTADTIVVDVAIVRWHFDSTASAWIREASATYPSGERIRYDTVWFYGSNGVVLGNKRPTLAEVDSVVHHRCVTRTRNGYEANINMVMRISITKTATDTIAVKNGFLDGTYAGIKFPAAGTVTNVTRYRQNGVWQFPESGTIYIDRVLKTVLVEFKGNGTATATVTRKRDDKVRIVNITVSNGEES